MKTRIAQGTPQEREVDIEPTGQKDVLGNPIHRIVSPEHASGRPLASSPIPEQQGAAMSTEQQSTGWAEARAEGFDLRYTIEPDPNGREVHVLDTLMHKTALTFGGADALKLANHAMYDLNYADAMGDQTQIDWLNVARQSMGQV